MRSPTSFLEPAESNDWHAVTDRVMGGVSAGALHFEDGIGVFGGRLSLEHGGGFASVRRAVSPGVLADTVGMAIRVRGDGRRYQCRVGTDEVPSGVSYTADFDTVAGRWLEIALAWPVFKAVFRGRDVPDAPLLSPERVNRLGFLLADRRAGPFRLEIAILRGNPES